MVWQGRRQAAIAEFKGALAGHPEEFRIPNFECRIPKVFRANG